MNGKYFKLLLIITFIFSNYFCHGQGFRKGINSIQIHIDDGPSQNIRWFKEGMIWRTHVKNIDDTYKYIITFYPIDSLNLKILYELQSFVYNDPFFSKDTICDKPGYGTTTIPMFITIIKDDELTLITWVDGHCKELEKLIDMINDLIPKYKGNLNKISYKFFLPTH
jgi:hypothetical protein